MARVTVKNDNITFEVPDGDRILPYLYAHAWSSRERRT